MISLENVKSMLELGDEKLKPLFKEKQLDVLRKVVAGEDLTETQERYLRGSIKTKLNLLFILNQNQYDTEVDDYLDFLKILDQYYITGLEALKNNGYGWDYSTKIIEVVNTRIKGEVKFTDKIIKFIKVKSLKNSEFKINNSNKIKYATNEQTLKDLNLTKNNLVDRRWTNLYKNYGKTFSRIKSQGKINENNTSVT